MRRKKGLDLGLILLGLCLFGLVTFSFWQSAVERVRSRLDGTSLVAESGTDSARLDSQPEPRAAEMVFNEPIPIIITLAAIVGSGWLFFIGYQQPTGKKRTDPFKQR